MQSLTGSGHLQQFLTKELPLKKIIFGGERWSRIGGGRLRETVAHVSITPSVSCYLHLNVFHEKKKTTNNRNQKKLYCTFYITIQYNFNPGQNVWDILCFRLGKCNLTFSHLPLSQCWVLQVKHFYISCTR